MTSSRLLLIATIVCTFSLACNKGEIVTIDQGVIIAEKAEVRNSTALVSTPLKELKRGQQVDILEHRSVNQREFTRVRITGDQPLEGWLETRFVISKRIVDECEKLAQESQEISTQAIGRTKDKLNLRLKPGRDSDVVTVLSANTKVDIVGRARAERRVQGEAGVKYDNWFKVRIGGESVIKAGWIYADSIELVPPDAIAPLPGAGRRFVAWQPFGKVLDTQTNNEESHYIILDKYAYSKDDEIDFDRIYVVFWDSETHAYESIYIESQLRGLYPLKVETKDDGFVFTVPLINRQEETLPARYAIKLDAKTDRYRISRIVEPKPASKTITKR
ncbi:MAG: SH3 domain-containing protein [Acidobacteriota bacterium]